jgi:hypothetical protein
MLTHCNPMRYSLSAVSTCVALLATAPLSALEIRSYASSRHDRFTGFPSAPVVNAGSWFTGSLYTGVGWSVSDTRRQFALVSPRHFLLASHWGILAGEQIRFLGPDGQTHTFTVASTTRITTGTGPTDLTLGRFTETVPLSSGVTPFAYLKLQNDNQYLNRSLQVFGFNARVGSGTTATFVDAEISPKEFTRLVRFDYVIAAGAQDDCYFAVGDSGSPSFSISNGKPALVGTHTAVNGNDPTTPTIYHNYDTFVPHYITELDALMATDGWQMIPSNAASNTLTRSASSASSTLRQAHAGTATFTVQNANNAANNLRLSLTFPSGTAPDSITADGWIVDASGPLTWSFHNQSLTASSSLSVTANWSSVPAVSSMEVQMTTQSDGSAMASSAFTFTPQPTFAAWSAGLSQPGLTDDPDGDGVPNVREYAFGSDPANGSSVNASGVVAIPVLNQSGSNVLLRFPVRSDSATRGLWYRPEYSQTLDNDWTETAPAGTTISFAEYSPAVPGFVEETVTIPVGSANQFARVKVTLDEGAPGMSVP